MRKAGNFLTAPRINSVGVIKIKFKVAKETVCFFECDRSHHALCLVRVNGISERDRE
jgi:hypothetical protein